MITLLELRTLARQRSDTENSDVVTDPELTTYINGSIAELHDLLVGAYGTDYFVADPYSISTVSGTATYALPADFYQLKGVDIQQGTKWRVVDRFNFNERNLDSAQSVNSSGLRYRLNGNKLKLSPTPTSTRALQIWYIPKAVKLVTDSDSFDDVNQWYEYVIVDAAIKVMVKQELDIQTLVFEKDALTRRIVAMAANRDAGQTETIGDIDAEDDWRY